MIYMTKPFLFGTIILALSSCAQISYNQAIPLLRTAIIGAKDINVDSEFLEARKFSFVKINLGRSAVAIMPLASIGNDGSYKWVNSTGEVIYTLNGKIIKTVGIVYDMELFNYDDFDLNFSSDTLDARYEMQLHNPKGFITQSAKISFKAQPKSKNTYLAMESIQSHGFRWNYKNSYLVNSENKLVLETEQHIHPKYPPVKLEFHYKF